MKRIAKLDRLLAGTSVGEASALANQLTADWLRHRAGHPQSRRAFCPSDEASPPAAPAEGPAIAMASGTPEGR